MSATCSPAVVKWPHPQLNRLPPMGFRNVIQMLCVERRWAGARCMHVIYRKTTEERWSSHASVDAVSINLPIDA